MNLNALGKLVNAAYRPTYEAMVHRYEALLAAYPDAYAAPAWRDALDWYRRIVANLDEQEDA